MNAMQLLAELFSGQIRDDLRDDLLENLAAIDHPEGTCTVRVSATFLYRLLRELSDVQRNTR